MTQVIVLGNEKGGSGKSTLAMHIIVALLKMKHKVGAIDLDMRQRSLSRYFENRDAYRSSNELDLEMPVIADVFPSGLDSRAASQEAETENMQAAFASLGECDYVVIDCPGADTHLSRIAHLHADTIITPLNDSFIDFDLLARLDDSGTEIARPSVYAEMVWEARKRRAMTGVPGGIDWVVVRNRLSATRARNKKVMGERLDDLSARIGFRMARGFGDRVIYRELFPLGLTLLDLGGKTAPVRLSTMSHITARLEIRSLIAMLRLDDVADSQPNGDCDEKETEQGQDRSDEPSQNAA